MRSISTSIFLWLFVYHLCSGQQIIINGRPSQLSIYKAGSYSVRMTIRPVGSSKEFLNNPALDEMQYGKPGLTVHSISKPLQQFVGNINLEINTQPLKIIFRNRKMQLIQEISFTENGSISFKTGNSPVLGMGEGGPKPIKGTDWRLDQIQFDRRGVYDSMQPRWQANAYGSRNPVPLLIGTEGWALFVATPWIEVDLRNPSDGFFNLRKFSSADSLLQNEKNQGLNQSKGLPPAKETIAGYYDLFIFDAHDPLQFMKDLSRVIGESVMPPRWALGYMQSHRLLESEQQMIGVADSFRIKKLPVDAVIYLGTGFTPKGWNKPQPSFEFNPELFRDDPGKFITAMHERNLKVVLHMVPWDRDKLPVLDESAFPGYWQQHVPLVKAGVDGWWPDEGDWFNLFERMKRHEFYYTGPLSTQNNVRPWSLHRNGFIGVAKWGGWVWSGDTESSWKTLEGQIAVGINHSLSLSPFWGSDIGGFYPNEELTGELYIRWFQFGAFCPSFRAHGRTWWTRLPWGWGLSDMGPKENRENPLQSEMNNPAIEPIAKKYDDLRYQLLSYNYGLAWEAREKGLPMMRALWLHYPDDSFARKAGDEYLWGKNILVAPVYKKQAAERMLYLPEGKWYDWWTNTVLDGKETISKTVDLATMPIYVHAGAIIPIDPVRQYTNEPSYAPLTIKIFSGENGSYELYEDDGMSQEYLSGKYELTRFTWNDAGKKLSIEPGNQPTYHRNKTIRLELIPEGKIKTIKWPRSKTQISF
ncbi:MAG: glycoside hydrolase family 31 protein [Chitinophagaceae bacterium]